MASPDSTARIGTAALVLAVVGTTVASQAGVVSVAALAASPRRLAEGKLWFLFSDGLLAQRPVALSLFSFAVLAFLTLSVCGARVLFWSALAGHVGSTLLAYSLFAAVVAADPGAVRGLATAPDWGVSAIQAAWIGALAAAGWRRNGQAARGRVLIVLACIGVGLIAWMLRGDLTLLDTDHLFAFAIGVAFAVAGAGRATPSTAAVLRQLLLAAREWLRRRVGSAAPRRRPLARANR